MSIAPSPTFAAGLWVATVAVWIVSVGVIALELVDAAFAAAVVLAMIYATATLAGRRWSK